MVRPTTAHAGDTTACHRDGTVAAPSQKDAPMMLSRALPIDRLAPALAGLLVLGACSAPAPSAPPAAPGPSAAAPAAELVAEVEPPGSLAHAVAAMDGLVDSGEAMKLLRAIDPYFRVRGNDGYRRAADRVALLLGEAGFAQGSADGAVRDTLELRDLGPDQPAWTPLSGRLELLVPEPQVLHAFDNEAGLERTFVCVNSFPTRPEGLVAPLVRYEPSRPVDSYAGTVVFGNLPAELLFARAVQQGGALGVVSSWLPDYNQAELHPDMIRFARIPYDEQRHAFALNVSPRSARALQERLARGPVHVRVAIAARFAPSRGRSVLATIGGTLPQAGAVAVVGHLDEPGAGDNGTGVAAMAAMAAGYLRAIRDGSLPRPRRPIIFFFGIEIEGSHQWLESGTEKVDMAVVLDMVGQDQALTGALALLERAPDPGAIWDRPPLDQHTEWGRKEDLRESDLRGTYLNDYVLAALRARATATGWNVRDNPFEGGSDHEAFHELGIPAVLLWHFTDRYYHTNLDRLDKVSEEELKHSAVAALGVIHHFAHAGLDRAHEVLDLVLAAARRRLQVEAANARAFLAAPAVAEDPVQSASVARRERQILVAWSRWYREALQSVEDFDPDPTPSDEHLRLVQRIDEATAEVHQLEHELLQGI